MEFIAAQGRKRRTVKRVIAADVPQTDAIVQYEPWIKPQRDSKSHRTIVRINAIYRKWGRERPRIKKKIE